MSERETLAACPFCGGSAYFRHEMMSEDCVETWGECRMCGIRGPVVEDAGPDRATAAALWNRRADLAPAPQPEAGWQVKPLEWENERYANAPDDRYLYQLWVNYGDSGEVGWLRRGNRAWNTAPSLEAAKAAAQADYEARIRACIEPAPNPVLKSGYPLRPYIDPDADDNPLGGDDPPYVLRRADGGAYADGDGSESLAEGWCLYVRADLPRPGTQPAPDPVTEAARRLDEWHEDYGPVVWWTWLAEAGEWLGEPSYIGGPLDSDWPGYHTHWTPHPPLPAALARMEAPDDQA